MPHEVEGVGGGFAGAALGIGIVGVAGIDDQVARPQQRAQLAIWSSTTGPAGTIRMIERGGVIAATNSSSVWAGVSRAASAPAEAMNASVTLAVRLKTAIA